MRAARGRRRKKIVARLSEWNRVTALELQTHDIPKLIPTHTHEALGIRYVSRPKRSEKRKNQPFHIRIRENMKHENKNMK